MSRPKFTVTLGTNRPGGIDISLAGLARQTYEDFEVVIIDGRYHERHERVLAAVKHYGIKQPVYHVPNHRYGDDIWGVSCAGYNTGFMLANGEFVVMLLDYAYAPPDWLAHHAKSQDEKTKIIMAPHEYRSLHGFKASGKGQLYDFTNRRNIDDVPVEEAIRRVTEQKARFDEISVFPQLWKPSWLPTYAPEESDVKCQLPTSPLNFLYFNTKNESFPTSAALDINGMDENYDKGRGPGDPDLGYRLMKCNLEGWNVREAIVHCLNPRKILPNINIIIPENGRLGPPYEHRWYVQDGYAHFDKTKADDKLVFAANPYNLRRRREEIWNWREMSLEKEPIIPKNVVSDSAYFG